jgi:hypothetical protein
MQTRAPVLRVRDHEEPEAAGGEDHRLKIMYVTTVAVSLRLMTGRPAFLHSRGFNVTAACASGPELQQLGHDGHDIYAIPMARRVTPFTDVRSVMALWRIMRRERPDVVHSYTPKGGLLGTIAAWLARVPVRIYGIQGLPLMTATGPKTILVAPQRNRGLSIGHTCDLRKSLDSRHRFA